jgi:hypothetical protein
MRCLSASLQTATIFAGINVIAALSTLISRQIQQTFTGVCVFRLYEFNCMQLALGESLSFEKTSIHSSLGRMSSSNIIFEQLP